MQWYHYFAGFWSGAFLANFVPHFVKGVCGDRFPSPFAKPPGKGLSSPVLNVCWALLNGLIGFVLLKTGRVSLDNTLSLLPFLGGFALMSIFLANNFQHKDKE